MQQDAIVLSLDELGRWRRRQAELREELERANRQVAYYEALLKDMKREVRPPRLIDFLKQI